METLYTYTGVSIKCTSQKTEHRRQKMIKTDYNLITTILMKYVLTACIVSTIEPPEKNQRKNPFPKIKRRSVR